MSKRVLFVSLGCDKNLVDTEMMMGLLAQEGYVFTDDLEDADIAIVNTCCFIGDAKEESINTILELAEARSSGQLRALLVAGCLGQRYREELPGEIPEVDAILGISSIGEIVPVLETVLAGEKQFRFGALDTPPLCGVPRMVTTTGNHYSYLKIAEGCNKHCTYCVIPGVRGGYRSVPMEQLVEDAKALTRQGVTELILVAQETTLYGVDLYGEKKLPELLEQLSAIPELHWIRIQYCYPEEITDEIVDAIARLPKICHYLDLPIQHASDDVLHRMGRKTDQEALRNIIARLRERIPDICLRTTLISGFPGETQEDYEELYRFVNEMEFDRLGVFPYSREENTPAAEMPDQVPEEVKRTRADELMELQQAIAFEKAESMPGRILECIVEGYVPDQDIYVARSYMDSPGIDGFVFTSASRSLMTGDYISVRITGSNEYDLIGEMIDEDESAQ